MTKTSPWLVFWVSLAIVEILFVAFCVAVLGASPPMIAYVSFGVAVLLLLFARPRRDTDDLEEIESA